MMRAAVLIAMLGMCAWSFAQTKTTSQSGQAGQTPSGQTQSSQGQSGQAQAAPEGKRPPQAKTQPEFDDYKAAMALTDPAALEKAANDFATKYPESELRVMLYKAAMQRYQQANNGDKMMEMAQKALSYDPDDPEALIGVAQVLTERTRDTDLDKDQRLAEAKKDAERALTTIDTDVPTSGYPPEQLAAYKGFLRSNAYAVLGTLASNAKNWPEAESDLRKSIDAFPQQLDSVAVLRLAVALDMQNKFPEALKYANQAVDLTKDHADSPAGKAARAEQDRLTKLNSGTAPGQSAPAKN
jgi:tetratricopeptide (TPR) repeat protein